MRSMLAATAPRPVVAFLATLTLALGVAAAAKRAPADFSALPPIAVVRDDLQRPLWAIRVARAAHQIAADTIGTPPPQAGHAYQLWLVGPHAAHSLGLLPVAGRKIIPEIPSVIARLAARGELIVTLEAAHGSDTALPSGPVRFRAPYASVISGWPSRTGCAAVAGMSGSQ